MPRIDIAISQASRFYGVLLLIVILVGTMLNEHAFSPETSAQSSPKLQVHQSWSKYQDTYAVFACSVEDLQLLTRLYRDDSNILIALFDSDGIALVDEMLSQHEIAYFVPGECSSKAIPRSNHPASPWGSVSESALVLGKPKRALKAALPCCRHV